MRWNGAKNRIHLSIINIMILDAGGGGQGRGVLRSMKMIIYEFPFLSD